MKLVLICLFWIGSFTMEAPKKKVFICTDTKSQIYHWDELCKELEKCKYEVKKIDKSEAVDQERRPCKVCKEPKEEAKEKKD